MMSKKSLALSMLAAGLFMSGSAFAGPFTTTPETKNFSLSFGDPLSSISFTGFDSSLGSLESVHITLTVNHEELISYASVLTGGAGNVTNAFSTGSLSVTGSNGLSVTNNALSTTPFTGGVNGFFTQIGSATLASAVSTSSSITGTPTTLASYIGGANAYSLSLASQTLQSGTCVFPTSCGSNGTADGTVSIYYDYSTTSVPEPTSLSLLGIGALGFVARRRKASMA